MASTRDTERRFSSARRAFNRTGIAWGHAQVDACGRRRLSRLPGWNLGDEDHFRRVATERLQTKSIHFGDVHETGNRQHPLQCLDPRKPPDVGPGHPARAGCQAAFSVVVQPREVDVGDEEVTATNGENTLERELRVAYVKQEVAQKDEKI